MSGGQDATGLTIGVVGPVPPRRCGVAEATAWTAAALADAGAEVRTVAVGSADAEVPPLPARIDASCTFMASVGLAAPSSAAPCGALLALMKAIGIQTNFTRLCSGTDACQR